MNIENIVRIGKVSSVSSADRTARVTFEDKNNLVSGPLKVLRSSPFIPASGEIQQTEEESGGTGEAAFEVHTHKLKISPWLPSPGEMVLCVFLPNGDGDGFVIGGI